MRVVRNRTSFGVDVWLARFCLLLLGFAVFTAPGFAQRRFGPPPEHTFRFRFVGPVRGNRVASVAGVPGDPSTYYAGAASGGVWKSTDGGNRWLPIFDKEPVQAIGALAVAPSDHNVVWVGTGEAWAIRDSDVMGDGVYRSSDAGKTWTHMGLDHTGRIGRILVNPRDENEVFVCALGRTPVRSRSAACTARWMAASTGIAFSSPTSAPVAPVWPWIRKIRAHCLPECGKSKCTPMQNSAAARAAEYTSRTTAARSGRALRRTVCRSRPLARLTSPLLQPIRIACTR